MLNSSGQAFTRLTRSVLTSRALWLVLGISNVIAGVLIALRAEQSFDVATVAGWCRDWLHGVNPYPGSAVRTNYPPYSIALLSPLALVPAGLVKSVWAIVSAGLAALVAWLGLTTSSGDRDNRIDFRLPLGFFLAWEAVRVGLDLGQFTLLSLAFGLAAVRYPGKVGRGILLGLSLIKPQIGGAFLLWAFFEGAFASVGWAAAPAVLGTLLFAVRLGESPIQAITQFAAVLREELAAPGFRSGALELRPLIHDLIGQPTIADAIHLGLAASALALLVFVSRHMSHSSRQLFLLPLTCVWTLMSVYHPSYDLVLLWPAMVACSVWLAEGSFKPIALSAVAVIQMVMVVDIPGLWWKWHGRPFPITGQGLSGMVVHFDRLLVFGVFVGLLAVSVRWRPANDPVQLAATAVPVS